MKMAQAGLQECQRQRCIPTRQQVVAGARALRSMQGTRDTASADAYIMAYTDIGTSVLSIRPEQHGRPLFSVSRWNRARPIDRRGSAHHRAVAAGSKSQGLTNLLAAMQAIVVDEQGVGRALHAVDTSKSQLSLIPSQSGYHFLLCRPVAAALRSQRTSWCFISSCLCLTSFTLSPGVRSM